MLSIDGTPRVSSPAASATTTSRARCAGYTTAASIPHAAKIHYGLAAQIAADNPTLPHALRGSVGRVCHFADRLEADERLGPDVLGHQAHQLLQGHLAVVRTVDQDRESGSGTSVKRPPSASSICAWRRWLCSGVSGRAVVSSNASLATRSGPGAGSQRRCGRPSTARQARSAAIARSSTAHKTAPGGPIGRAGHRTSALRADHRGSLLAKYRAGLASSRPGRPEHGTRYAAGAAMHRGQRPHNHGTFCPCGSGAAGKPAHPVRRAGRWGSRVGISGLGRHRPAPEPRAPERCTGAGGEAAERPRSSMRHEHRLRPS